MERGRNREQQERLPREAGGGGRGSCLGAREGRLRESRKAVSFLRGLFLSLLLGGLAWALVGLLVYYLFFA